MKRTAAFALSLVTLALAGCSSDSRADPASPAAAPSGYSTGFAIQSGGRNPEASIPNPGTGQGDPRLITALLPPGTAGRASAVLLPPAVIAMPDTNPESIFIGLRQAPSPVAGPPECLGWTIGLSRSVLADFNRPGVQLAIGSQPATGISGQSAFSETIVTGPARVLSALLGARLPANCRAITVQTPQPGGVRPLPLTLIGRGGTAYEVTGTGKTPVWQWAEVLSGPGFLLEIRIPVQSADTSERTQLTAITTAAYQRAISVLNGR